MNISRFYIASRLKTGEPLTLNIVLSKRLLHVLRLKLHEQLILFNGREKTEFLAEFVAIAHDRVVVEIKERLVAETESPLQIHLGQGIARGEKMDFIIQKTTELGVNKITPLITQFCNVKLKKERLHNKMQHWQMVGIAAAEQSGRVLLPQILQPKALDIWLENADIMGCDLSLILVPEAKQNLLEAVTAYYNKKQQQNNQLASNTLRSISILVGPEGGMSDAEVALAAQNGFISVNLGPRVLRTETAALAAIAILQAHLDNCSRHLDMTMQQVQ